jgi:hypothetical protein
MSLLNSGIESGTCLKFIHLSVTRLKYEYPLPETL